VLQLVELTLLSSALAVVPFVTAARIIKKLTGPYKEAGGIQTGQHRVASRNLEPGMCQNKTIV